MLLHEFDSSQTAMFNPTTAHQPVPGMPKVAVSCFSFVTFNRLLEGLNAQPIAQMKTASQLYPIYKATYKGVDVALFLAGVGAPVCVGSLEEIFVMGVETVVLFGTCGVLDRDIRDCSIILPTSALRDEGTSYHYAPPGDEIAVNTRYGQLFADMLDELRISYVSGKCWTTDAMYRETREKVARRKAQGCICVDMECASCAAAAQFRGKGVLQFFYAADNLDAEEWDPRSLSSNAMLEEKDRIALLALEAAVRISNTTK
ncbi:MAG: nucleoside phosphorylase [Clostridia bacterium]|nr:nucleoside phosphorylase [Clostridia bacterium]